jgi:hypothetical protein
VVSVRDPVVLLVVVGLFRLLAAVTASVISLRADRIRGQLALSLVQVAGPGSVFIASRCASGGKAVIAYRSTGRPEQRS